MTYKKSVLLAGAVMAAALVLAACSSKQAAAAPSPAASAKTTSSSESSGAPTTESGYKSITAVKVTFQWKVDGKNLDCILSAPTTGWVGVGFGHTAQMKGTELFIGFVQDGKTTVMDEYGDAINHHDPVTALGGKSIVSNVSGSQSNGTTEVRFTLPLNDSGKYHVPLVPGTQYDLLLAHAPNGAADATTYHGPGNRTAVQITL